MLARCQSFVDGRSVSALGSCTLPNWIDCIVALDEMKKGGFTIGGLHVSCGMSVTAVFAFE